jgi:hypothetical protein
MFEVIYDIDRKDRAQDVFGRKFTDWAEIVILVLTIEVLPCFKIAVFPNFSFDGIENKHVILANPNPFEPDAISSTDFFGCGFQIHLAIEKIYC